MIPPDDISSSYTYQECLIRFVDFDGHTKCLKYSPAVMDPLKVSPPFSYSYQCGSTLLVSYIPVYMYSVSLQFVSTMVKLGIISTISSDLFPAVWLMKWLSPVAWPWHLFHKLKVISESSNSFKSPPLIKPHQIILTVINNLILLLSFGLCSPVLGCYIALSTCVTLSCWLMFVGRFLSYHFGGMEPASITSRTSYLQSEVNPVSRGCDIEHEGESPNETKLSTHADESLGEIDPFISLLNSQLFGVNTYIPVCKWPIIFSSCLFVTLLCWDMVGDHVGWEKGLWVTCVGVLMFLAVWLWDHYLLSKMIDLNRHHRFLTLFFSFPPRNSSPHNLTAMELTHPSLGLSSSQNSVVR